MIRKRQAWLYLSGDAQQTLQQTLQLGLRIRAQFTRILGTYTYTPGHWPIYLGARAHVQTYARTNWHIERTPATHTHTAKYTRNSHTHALHVPSQAHKTSKPTKSFKCLCLSYRMYIYADMCVCVYVRLCMCACAYMLERASVRITACTRRCVHQGSCVCSLS